MGAELTGEQIGALKATQEAQKNQMDRFETGIWKEVREIRSELKRLSNRPSWVTVIIISFLSSGFFAMLAITLKGT